MKNYGQKVSPCGPEKARCVASEGPFAPIVRSYFWPNEFIAGFMSFLANKIIQPFEISTL